MSDDVQKFKNALVDFTAMVCAAIFVVVWNGYVLSRLWRWLVAPIFHAHILTVFQAIAVCFVIRYLTPESYTKDEYKDELGWKWWFAKNILLGLLFLAMGALLSNWI